MVFKREMNFEMPFENMYEAPLNTACTWNIIVHFCCSLALGPMKSNPWPSDGIFIYKQITAVGRQRDRLSWIGWHITSWYWSIHEHGPHLFCSDCHLSWDSRVDSGGVNQQRSLLHLPRDGKTNSIKVFWQAKFCILCVSNLATLPLFFFF